MSADPILPAVDVDTETAAASSSSTVLPSSSSSSTTTFLPLDEAAAAASLLSVSTSKVVPPQVAAVDETMMKTTTTTTRSLPADPTAPTVAQEVPFSLSKPKDDDEVVMPPPSLTTATAPPPPSETPAPDASTAAAATATLPVSAASAHSSPPPFAPPQEPKASRSSSPAIATAAAFLPAKRPSPWRKTTVSVAANPEAAAVQEATRREAQEHCLARRKQKRAERRLWQDVVTIHIPLDHSGLVDLGVALQRTRAKQSAALVKAFPHLAAMVQQQQQEDAQRNGMDDNAEHAAAAADQEALDPEAPPPKTKPGPKPQAMKKRKQNANMPQPREYASMLDYLEAKYIQGVMIQDEPAPAGGGGGGGTNNNKHHDSNDEEGQGSVYSETSFLDDTDLQRNVAEQVLAHTTMTKLELQDEDNQFFVNVGNLEVEETEMTQAKYDPLQDVNPNNKKTQAVKRKRKHPTLASGAATKVPSAAGSVASNKTKASLTKTTTAATKKKKAVSGGASTTSSAASAPPPKKKAKPAAAKEDSKSTAASKKKKIPKLASSLTKAAAEAETAPILTTDQTVLERKSQLRKERVDALHGELVDMIQASSFDELPRRKTKVSLTCPTDKGPGDEVTFTNPHVPGQKLRVKIPKSAKPGNTFKVTVPVVSETTAPGEEETDHNKFSRAFYDTLEEYARAYDEWCDAQGDFYKALGDKDFAAHTAKRQKFDQLVAVFPSDLRTPVDKPYIQKILRRARQNKHKREQTLARQAAQVRPDGEGDTQKDASSLVRGGTTGAAAATTTAAGSSVAPATSSSSSSQRRIVVPTLATVFPKIAFDANAFL